MAGQRLDEAGQTHLAGCPGCTRVADEHFALEALLVDELDNLVQVPDGFADRVMARLDEVAPDKLDRLLGRRWFQIALAHVGLAMAIANVLRFVLASLVPSASLGGAR